MSRHQSLDRAIEISTMFVVCDRVMTKTLELRIAKRMARLGTETAFEVLVKARALEANGRDIVHLEIGEPDFDTPGNIIDAGCDALHKSFTHYGPSAGLPQLRETIAQYVSETRRVEARPEEVVVVPGGKPIIFFTILALVEEGDEVIYPNPGFPIYESMINYVGAKAVPIRLREEKEFRLDVDELGGLINDRTKLIILNSRASIASSTQTWNRSSPCSTSARCCRCAAAESNCPARSAIAISWC